MNSFELTGNLVEIMPTQTFNKGFKKREFVIEIEDGRFTQKILFQAVQDKCEMLDSFGIGDTVKVAFNIKGREFNGKYYNALEAFRVFGEKRADPISDEQELDILDDPDLFPEKGKRSPKKSELETVPSFNIEDDLPF
jgi:hypothetical protein